MDNEEKAKMNMPERYLFQNQILVPKGMKLLSNVVKLFYSFLRTNMSAAVTKMKY